MHHIVSTSVWVHCPVCGAKTRTRVYADTVLTKFPMPFTLGRKNWLFCDTVKGAEASAIVYSMVESAKANGIEPFAYLQHVLVQLPYLGKSHSHEELESLMPWAPYIQQNFRLNNSDAYTNTYLD